MRRHTKSKSLKIVYAIAFLIFVIYTAFILFFPVMAIILAIKPDFNTFLDDMLNMEMLKIHSNFALKNFFLAFKEFQIGTHTYLEMLFHSLWRTLGGVGLSWLSTAMVTYILVFYRCRFTKFIYYLGFFLSTIPLYGAGAAEYKLFAEIGLINNPLILVTKIALYGGYFFYMYAFWKSISWSYAEAALIDGAGHFSLFTKVMFPMAVPSMMALFIMSLIAEWNSYESTLLYMTEFPNLSYALYAYEESTKYNVGELGKVAYFAGLLVSISPVLILFAVFQNSIMEKVYIGGLKG